MALKIFIQSASLGQQLDDELNIYKRIEGASRKHPGRKYVRSLLDSFDIGGPEGVKHRCLVHPPLFESVLSFLYRNPVQRLPTPILVVVLHRLFLALDYLHTECRIIHTGISFTTPYNFAINSRFILDIKADNLMFDISDDSVFRDFEDDELHTPSPRKELNGRTVYLSRDLRMPGNVRNLDPPVLCDFGSAVYGDQEHLEDVQPNIYRSPEVILEVPWTYSADIWNVGCMVPTSSPMITQHWL